MSINKVIIKRVKKAAEAAYLMYTLTGPLAGLPLPGMEAALGKVAKCHAECLESRKRLREYDEDILAYVLNNPKAGKGV